MANNIDRRIVEMQFDNAQFEKGVSTSLESLEKLKKGLELDSAVESLKSVETKLNKMDFSGIANSLSEIQGHFTTLGRNIDRTIDNIISNATSKLTNFWKSTVSGGSGSGFSKYETQTKSVQTITNATGKSVEEVEAVLGKLQKYTDETSYDFAEMASTIGKFTSVGVELERAETAMEGIANVAAVSGAGKTEANRAMYNFAQSLSQGSVKLIDWKSIENANMATKEFKEELIKTAISMGTITKVTDTAGKIVTQTKAATKKTAAQFKETAVDYKTFNETLKDGWLTSDVLITTLERYANKEDGVGKKAYEAAQKALTFTDAIDAIKDAISSSWMQSFKLMFGNLTESIDLWTNFCNAIIEVTDEIGSYRNELLEGWHTQGGYNDLIESASNIWTVFVNVLHMVRDAFNSIIPATTADDLVTITSKIKEVTESWKNFFDYIGTGSTEETVKELVNYAKEFEDNIKSGMSGDYVKLFQQALIDAGYTIDKYGADGIYGTETQNALKRLQKDLGVSETGKWDEATRKAAILSGKFQGMEEVTKEISRGLGDTYTVLESYTETIDYASQIRTGLQYKASTKGTDWDLLEDAETELLNEMLVYAGYMDNAQATSFFGPETEKAIKKLQAEYGLAQTGIWDEQTQAVAKANGLFSVTVTRTEEVTKTVGAQNSAMERLMTAIQGVASAWSIVTNLFKLGVRVLSYVWSLFSPIRDALLTVVSVIGTCLISLNDFLNKSGAYDAWFNAIKAALTPFGNLLKTIGDGINNFFANNKGITTFTELWAALKKEISKNKVFKTIITYLEKFWDVVKKTRTAMKSLADVAKKWIVDKLTGLFTKGKDGVSGFQKSISDMTAGISNKFNELKKKYPIIDYLAGKFNTVKDAVTTFYESAKTKLSGFFDSMGNFNSTAFLDWIKEKIEAVKATIISFKDSASESLGKVGTYFSTAYNNVSTWFTNLRKNYPIIDTIITAIEKVFGSISSFATSVKDAFSNAFSNGTFNKEKFFETVKTKFDELKQNLLNFVNWIKISFVKFSFKFPWLSNLIDFLKGAVSTLKDFATAVKDSIINVFTKDTSGDSTLLDKIKTKLEGLQPIVDWFIGVKDKLVEAWNNLTGKGSSEEGSGSGFSSFVEQAKKIFESVKGFKWTSLIGPAIGIALAKSFLTNGGIIGNISKSLKNLTTAAVLKFGGKQDDQIGTMMLKLAGAVAIVAASIGLLSLADMDKVGKAVIKIGEVLLIVVGIGILAKELGGGNFGIDLLMLSASVAALAIGLGIMIAVISSEAFKAHGLEAIGIMALMLVGLAAVEILVSKFGGDATGGMGFSSVLGMCTGLVLIAISIGILSAVINKYGSSAWGAFVMMEVLLITMGNLFANISNSKAAGSKDGTKIKGFLSLAASLLILSYSITKLTKAISKDGKAAWQAFVMIEVLLITMSAIANAMSKNQTKVSSALASAVLFISMGGSICLIVEAFADALTKIKDVDVDIIKTFFEGIEIVMGIISTVAVVFSKIPVAALLHASLGIVAVFTAFALGIEVFGTLASDALDKFATAMWTLSAKLKDFDSNISNVKFERFQDVVTAVDLISGLFTSGKLVVVDPNSMDNFATAAQTLGSALSIMSTSLDGVTFDLFKEDSDLFTAIENLATLLTNENIKSANRFSTIGFVSAIQALGSGLANLSTSIADVEMSDYALDGEFYSGVINLMALVNVVSSGGYSTSSTEGFSNAIQTLGGGIDIFNTTLTGVEDAAASLSSASTLIDDTIDLFGRITKNITPEVSSNVSTYLEEASAAIALYYQNLKDVNPDSEGATPEQIRSAFTGLSEAMPDDTAISNIAAYANDTEGSQNLLDFAEGLVNLGSAIGKYGENIGTLDSGKVETANTILDTISKLKQDLSISSFTSLGAEVTAAEKDSTLSNFANDVDQLGAALKNYGDYISEIDSGKVESANSIIETIAGVSVTLTAESVIAKLFGFVSDNKSTLSNFATDIGELGSALENYGNHIGAANFTKENVENANSIIETIAGVQTTLTNNSQFKIGFMSFTKSNSDYLGSFANDIGQLGSALSNYATGIGGLNYGKVSIANKIIDKFATIELPTDGGFFSFLNGKQSLSDFASNFGSVGTGLANFADNISNSAYDKIDVDKALEPITILATAQSMLQDTGGLKSMFGGDANLGALGSNLSEYGDKLVEFSGKVKEFKYEDISQAVEAMKSVIDQQVRIGSKYTNIDAFSDLGNAINSFFITLSTYATGGTGATMADDVTNLVYDLIIDICDAISGETSKTNIGSAVKTLFSTATVAIYGYKTHFSLAAKGLIDETKTALGDPDGKIKSAINSAVSGAVTQVRNRYNDFYNAGNYLDQGLVVGIWKGSSAVSTTAWNVAVSAYNAACRALGIASPSKEFAKIGMFADMGLVNGLETYSDAVQSSASDVASGAIDGAQQGLTNFSSLIFDNMDDTPVIRPVLDLTDVQAGANAMNGMFRSQTVGLRSAELANRVSVSDYERTTAASVNTDSADIRGTIETLNARIDELGQRIMNMQVVTETGAIVGAITPAMDRALGNRSILAQRGAI